MVVLTQDPATAAAFAAALRQAGIAPVEWPLVRLDPVADAEVAPVLTRLADYDVAVLPSPSAVRIVAAQMRRLGADWPLSVAAGLIGAGSVEAFRAAFERPDIRVVSPAQPPYDGNALVVALERWRPLADLRVQVLRRSDGRTGWIEALRTAGARVSTTTAYRATAVAAPPSSWAGTLAQARAAGRVLHWIVGARSQIDTLDRWLGHQPGGDQTLRDPALDVPAFQAPALLDPALLQWARAGTIHVPHPAIAAHAQALGFGGARVFNDRRELIERLQYAAAVDRAGGRAEDVDRCGSIEAVAIGAAATASREASNLSSEPQKDPPKPFAASSKSDVSDARIVASPPAPATAPASAPAPSAAPPSAPTSPAATATAKGPTAAPTPASSRSSVPSPSPAAASAPIPAGTASAPAGGASVPSGAASVSAGAASVPSGAASAPSGAAPAPAGTASVSTGTGSSRPPASVAPSPSAPSWSGGSPPPAAAGGSRSGSGWWALLLLLLVVALAIAGWWYAQQRFLANERETARRVQEAEARAASLEEQIRSLRDSQAQLTKRSQTLESKIAESATQQEQMQSLYDELARTRGEGVLAEVEQAVVLANQHLELTGNVKAALLSLESAEKRLGDSDQSQAIGVRRLIVQDIERLRALPEIDLTRSAARLDEVINRVDRLPLLADAATPAAGAAAADAAAAVAAANAAAGTAANAAAGGGSAGTAPAAPAAAAAPTAPTAPTAPAEPLSAFERLYARVVAGGARSLDAVREEFRNLVTIRRIDQPDELLMSPDQKRQARENLRMLLLNARLNLLNRHEALFRQDLGRAAGALQRLFDGENPEVRSALASLQSLQAQPLAVPLPSLADSIAAIRAARAASEKRS
ncbi:MAG: uroporphyrinogen-III C-methyltransferase [Lautropia sp.]